MSALNHRSRTTPEAPIAGTPPSAVDELSKPLTPRVRRTPIRSAWDRLRRLVRRGPAKSS
jgi:hypothetical protein